MHEYFHVVLEALKHTAMVLPLLFVVYYLIELFEYKCANKIQKSKMLESKISPILGAFVGSVPQCGFSVISSDLFSKRKLSIGALLAVYIATSDEAIPIMFANPKSVGWMFLLIGVKIVFGVLIGYLTIWLHSIIFKNKLTSSTHFNDHKHDNDTHNEHGETVHGGCCHHHVETKTFDWLHPLLHCLKVSLFILIINVLFGIITHIWVGEQTLISFLDSGKYLQPLLAVMIGLIPNCASSIVLTELFLLNGLSFGALVAGLCANAGLGVVILLKQNKNVKENIFIISMLIIPSLILGYLLCFI